MPQPPSYRALRPVHQHFVSLYIRNGCDAFKTVSMMYQSDDDRTNRGRANRLLANPQIQLAISDKLQQREERYDTSRLAIVERLFKLLDKVGQLPDQQLGRAIKLELEVLKEVSAISGHHVMKHEVEQRSISINLVGLDDQPKTIDVKAEIVPAEEDPNQLVLSFPPVDAVTYSIDELDHISESDSSSDSPDFDDALPEGLEP